MSSAPRNHVRRANLLLAAALPALQAAANAVPKNATGVRTDAERAVHYLLKAIERADVMLASELPVGERRAARRRRRQAEPLSLELGA